MLIRDDRATFALARLIQNEDFGIVRGWLEASLAKADESNRSLEGVPLHRSQGVALVLQALLEDITQAPSVAHKIQTRR